MLSTVLERSSEDDSSELLNGNENFSSDGDGDSSLKTSSDIRRCLTRMQSELESLQTFRDSIDTSRTGFDVPASNNGQNENKIEMTLYSSLNQQLVNQSIITTQLQTEVDKLKSQVANLEHEVRRGHVRQYSDDGFDNIQESSHNFHWGSRPRFLNSSRPRFFDESSSGLPSFRSRGGSARRRQSLFIFNPGNKNSEEEEKITLPPDSYSFLACSVASSTPFWFGFAVFALQVATITFLILNSVSLSDGTNSFKMPANIDLRVRITQFIAIIISILVHDDILTSLEMFLAGHSKTMLLEFEDSSKLKYWFSFACHFVEALLVLLSSFLLVLAADDVTTLLLNFSAVAFVSSLDAVAFKLAVSGLFGGDTLEKAVEIQTTSYSRPSVKSPIRVRICQLTLVSLYLLMFTFWGMQIYYQKTGQYLCSRLHVQYGDNLAAHSGLYDIRLASSRGGHVKYIERRFQSPGTPRGVFDWCQDNDTWTFSYDTDDPCDWISKASVPFTYDILKSFSRGWNFRDSGRSAALAFEITCFEGDCVGGETCACPVDRYGLACNLQNPCPVLGSRKKSPFDDFAESTDRFEILRPSGNATSSVQAYNRPIYIGALHPNNSSELILFTGRRWVFVRNVRAITGGATTHAAVANYFSNNAFHASGLPYDSVTLMSEEAIETKSSWLPYGLKWYFPKRLESKHDGLPLPDLNRPINDELFCAFCNNISNPCAFKGECQSDGTCKCKDGAKGILCRVPPLNNGVCNQRFNNMRYNFDHGDCCGATCEDPFCGVAGLGTAFGSNLATRGDGFPMCIDPAMVPITLHLRTTKAYFLSLRLVCEGTNFLQIPHFALINDEFKGTEVVHVMDGTDCELILDYDIDNVGYIFDPAAYDIEVHFAKKFQHNSSDTTLITKAEGVYLNKGQAISIHFTVIKGCLFDRTVDVSPTTLKETTAQGKALRWLNSDTSVHSSCHTAAGRLRQRYVLAVLNFATKDILSKSSSRKWLSDQNECEWQGILCNSDNMVTGIELMNRNLAGHIPQEVGLLMSLKKLNLGYNNLGGSIPSSIGNLENLVEFQLFKNRLTGQIPTEIGYLDKLDILFLAHNELTGSVPSECGKMIELSYLILDMNHLTGELPSEIFNLVDLNIISLRRNQLSGTIASTIGNMKNLTHLILEDNMFFGSIPITIGELVQLEIIALVSNHFTGEIPNISNLSNLEELMLASNGLSGIIPTHIGKLSSLNKFQVSKNYLTGSIPTELGKLLYLRQLGLDSNNLTGTIPDLGNLINLAFLNIINNKITGTVPESLCDMDTLEVLFVDCESFKCAASCNCRGMDEKMNLFSCSSSEDYPLRCDSESVEFRVELIPDFRSDETSWYLRMNGTKMLKGGSEGGQICVPKESCGTFTIDDTGGNGICCDSVHGYGSYTLFLGDDIIAYGGRFEYTESVRFCAV